MNALSRIGYGSFAAVLVGCWLIPPPAHGSPGPPYLGLDVGDVIVATVTKVSAHAATNANPPGVELDVHEVLRGDPQADRSHAVWDGPPSDVDWAGQGAAEALEKWKNQPVVPPKVGSKMILWGQLRQDGDAAAFHVASHARFAYSEVARTWAVQMIRLGAEKRRATDIQQAAIARLAAGAKPPADAVARWRAQTSAEDIQRYSREADLVAVATLEDAGTYDAPPVALHFRVEEVLKGRLRDVAEILTSRKPPPFAKRPCWLIVSVPGRLFDLLDCRTRYVLFLSEDGLEFFSGEAVYPRIGLGDGLVIADDPSLGAVREAVRAEAPQAGAPRPIMMLQVAGNVLYPGGGFFTDAQASEEYRRGLIGQFQKAAQDRYATLPMTGFPPGMGGPKAAERDATIVPNGNTLVMLNFEKRNQPTDAPVSINWWAVRGGEGAMQIAFSGQDSLSGEQQIAARIADIVRRLDLTPKPNHAKESPR